MAYAYSIEGKSSQLMGLSLTYLSRIKLERRDFDSALYYANRAHEVLRSTDFRSEQLENFELYAKIYRELRDFQKASEYQQKYIELEAEIINGQVIKNISEIHSANEERENLKTIEEKDDLIALKEAQQWQLQLIIVISIAFAIILVIVSIILWKGMQVKRRIYFLLDKKVRERTLELEQSYKCIQQISYQQQESIDRLNKIVQSRVATLRGITEVAKLDIKDPASLSYFSRIEEEMGKLREAARN